MTELYQEFFAMLRFTKSLYDCGMGEQLKAWFGSCCLDGDNYWELAYEAIGWVFQDTRHYYNERDEIETWLFTDPVMDQFCKLCQEYEGREGISEKENPYRRDMEQIIHENFCFNSYSYGYNWRLGQEERGQKCILLFTGCEFYSHDEVPMGLLEVKAGFEAVTACLKKELSKETRSTPPVTAVQWKEAA